MLAAVSPVTRQASTTVVQSTGKFERMIVRAVPGLSDKVVNGPDLSLDYQNGLAESVDAYGHGTHMAGIIAGRDAGSGSLTDPTRFVGVAPDARIVNVKVGAADGSTDVSQVIA